MYVDRRDCVGGPGQEVALQKNSGYAAEVCLFFFQREKLKKNQLIHEKIYQEGYQVN